MGASPFLCRQRRVAVQPLRHFTKLAGFNDTDLNEVDSLREVFSTACGVARLLERAQLANVASYYTPSTCRNPCHGRQEVHGPQDPKL